VKIRRTAAAIITTLALTGIGVAASPGLDDVKASAGTEAASSCLRLFWFSSCLRLF